MTDPKIVGLGEPLIEMVRLADLIEGRPAFVQGFGGDTSTAMIAAARQGADAGYISAVGSDMFGEALRALWEREGVDHTHVRVREAAETGVCFIDPHPSGRRFTYARSGSAASGYSVSDLPASYIAQADALHVSGISLAISETMREAALEAIKIANESGTLVSFDVNHRERLWDSETAVKTIHAISPSLNFVFASDEEAAHLFGHHTPEATAQHFLDRGSNIVIAKRGVLGAYVATPDMHWEVPPAPSNPVDSSGAGDSFAGAFLAWFVETHDIELSANKAAEVAAATVSGLGAVEPIPRR